MSLLIPIIDAFIVFAERLFSAATKSDNLPPFQLKETFLSFTAYSYVPAGTCVLASSSADKKRSAAAVCKTSTLNDSKAASRLGVALTAYSSVEEASLELNGLSNE